MSANEAGPENGLLEETLSIELLKAELQHKTPTRPVVVSLPLFEELRREGELTSKKHERPVPTDPKYAQQIAEWLHEEFPILMTDELNWYTHHLKNHGGARVVADLVIGRQLPDDGPGSFEII